MRLAELERVEDANRLTRPRRHSGMVGGVGRARGCEVRPIPSRDETGRPWACAWSEVRARIRPTYWQGVRATCEGATGAPREHRLRSSRRTAWVPGYRCSGGTRLIRPRSTSDSTPNCFSPSSRTSRSTSTTRSAKTWRPLRVEGFPVGHMGPVTIGFMHFESFGHAVAKWTERARRVDLDNLALTFTDDGATEEHVASLPCRRHARLCSSPHRCPGVRLGSLAVPARGR